MMVNADSLLARIGTPADLKKWGAAWSEYSLSDLPAALPKLAAKTRTSTARKKTGRSSQS